jgi:exopolysaccharide biosynthesis polyprenyl glycosylphosphotransferase
VIRLFKVSIPSSVVALLVSEAILIFSSYVLAAYWTLDAAADVFLLDEGGLWSVALVVAVIMAGLYFHDLYENYRIRSRILLFQQFSLVLGVAFLMQALLNYGRWNVLLMPKSTMMYGSLITAVLVPTWRIVYNKVVMRALGSQRLLFLGCSQVVEQVIGQIRERPELGLAVVGYLDNDPEAPSNISGAPHLGCISDLDTVVAEKRPDSIVVGMTERRQNLPFERLLDLRLFGTRIEEASSTYEAIFHRVWTRGLHPSQLIFSIELGPRPASLALQSAYSLLISIVAVTVTLPIMAVVAVLVKLTSPGPIVLRQKRVGFNGVPFTLFKFRSMYQNAEAKTGAIWAAKDDPRITPLGRWLRRLRLDELPQLLNVLRGEMSVVGPRPERPEFVAALQARMPYFRQRHCVKPGITGWAQINHKYGDNMEDALIKLEFDLYYIKHFSVALDTYILFHTAKTMLLGRGAQ